MPVYRKCSICHKRVPDGTRCECEVKNTKLFYKSYKEKMKANKEDAKYITFYNTTEWQELRGSVAAHQFHLDIIEWSKGRIVLADTYHHIVEVRDEWDKRLSFDIIIGLTSSNHNKIHSYMNKGKKEKVEMQKSLLDLLKRFENEYY